MQPSPRPSARFAFVDLETSGVSPADDRITEVGIVLVDGGQVVDEWASLINPGCAIPAEIQSLTGITNAMVRQAPSFSAVLPDILHRLHDRTFVAHNARFDYGFLKAECRRIGLRFSAEVLCTVRLSRKLQPQFSTHSLDALIARHSLGTGERHRALGDARLIARFFAKLEEQFGLVALQQAIDGLLKRPSLPMHLNAASAALIATLPESPGVYTFLGAQGQALYIGKSRNLRDRVRAHFHADSRNANDARLASETHALKIEPTAGEFSALLKEMQAIKASAPLHNIALRKRAGICLIEANLESKAPRIVALDSLSQGHPTIDGQRRYGPFSARSRARSTLAQLGRKHRLCDTTLGLWKGDGPCFSRQVRRCEGLCEGREALQAHQARLLRALEPLKFPPWPYPGPVALTECDPDSGLSQLLVFDQWCEYRDGLLQPFDLDVFRLLRRHILRAPRLFSPLSSSPGLTSLAEAVLDSAPETDHN